MHTPLCHSRAGWAASRNRGAIVEKQVASTRRNRAQVQLVLAHSRPRAPLEGHIAGTQLRIQSGCGCRQCSQSRRAAFRIENVAIQPGSVDTGIESREYRYATCGQGGHRYRNARALVQIKVACPKRRPEVELVEGVPRHCVPPERHIAGAEHCAQSRRGRIQRWWRWRRCQRVIQRYRSGSACDESAVSLDTWPQPGRCLSNHVNPAYQRGSRNLCKNGTSSSAWCACAVACPR